MASTVIRIFTKDEITYLTDLQDELFEFWDSHKYSRWTYRKETKTKQVKRKFWFGYKTEMIVPEYDSRFFYTNCWKDLIEFYKFDDYDLLSDLVIMLEHNDTIVCDREMANMVYDILP